MERCEFITIKGKEYCLALTIGAHVEMMDKFGVDFKIDELVMASDTKKTKEIIRNVLWLVELLSKYGSDYMRVIEGKEYPKITQEDMLLMLSIPDIQDLRSAILDAALKGWSRDVVIEEGAVKNVIAPGD